jgi:hypothetical protein
VSQWKWIVLCSALLALPLVSRAQQAVPLAREVGGALPEFDWKQSLQIRSGDPSIAPIGGTEVRALVAFDKKLFAAIGYWMDTEKLRPELPGAQVLRLDSPDSEWKVDFELDERGVQNMRMYQAISNLRVVHVTTDDSGRKLPQQIDVLLAGVWKRGTGLEVFARFAGSGPSVWSRMPIPGQETAERGTQARSFFSHRDRVTGVDMIFLGATKLIIVGCYNSAQKHIVWNPNPEWQSDAIGKAVAAGRVSSFAEANGKLYAAVYGTIYERVDGINPSWKKVFETAINSPRVTGLRGLTAIANPSGPGEILLASVEDNPSRIYRVDPHQMDASGMYDWTLDLDVSYFLSEALGTPATYTGIAYNDTMEYPDRTNRCPRRLIGLETITRQAARTFGFQHFNSNAYYLVRDCSGKYVLRQIQDSQIEPKPDLVAVRTLTLSPFPTDPVGTVYAGGFDANRNPVHNTAWLYKGVPARTIR